MNLTEMRNRVRRDLHDEDAVNYRWSDDEIDCHIAHAISDFSAAVPLEEKVLFSTTDSSREIDISSLADRVMVAAVEYPLDQDPVQLCRFSLWGDVLTLLDDLPDGSGCYVYYGKLHTLDASGSTVPPQYEELIAAGAEAYAAMEWSAFAINRVNAGGNNVTGDYLAWGRDRMDYFRAELKRVSWKNKARGSSINNGI